jgi:hypothetical protein
MRLNPTAFVFWCLGAIAGYLINDMHGALIGLGGCMLISLLADSITHQ